MNLATPCWKKDMWLPVVLLTFSSLIWQLKLCIQFFCLTCVISMYWGIKWWLLDSNCVLSSSTSSSALLIVFVFFLRKRWMKPHNQAFRFRSYYLIRFNRITVVSFTKQPSKFTIMSSALSYPCCSVPGKRRAFWFSIGCDVKNAHWIPHAPQGLLSRNPFQYRKSESNNNVK